MKALTRFGARLVRSTFVIDRAYHAVDKGRAMLVTAFASDAVLSAYNDLTYAASSSYDAGSEKFREKLFSWEEELIGRVFPKPPCRVLVGGAGGGREPFQLAAMGYDVTAFDSSVKLARSMRDRASRTGAAVEALVGRYEDTPIMHRVSDDGVCDLSAVPPFQATLLGWSSFSHVRTTELRSDCLQRLAAVTDGPVAASVFLRPSSARRRSAFKRFFDTLGRRSEGDAFTAHLGYYHLSSREELEAEVSAAGLEFVVKSYDESEGRWPWIAVARPQIAARLAAANR